MALTDGRLIGEWYFEVSPALDHEQLPDVVSLSAETLRETELLVPRRLHLSHWIRPAGEGFDPAAIRTVDVAVGPVLSPGRIARAIADTRAEVGDDRAIPRVGVSGHTVVIEPGGKRRVEENLLRLDAGFDGVGITVHLSTSGTVWLPFDLAGRPQEAIAAGNAPRLALALRRLADRLDAEVNAGGPTRYAVATPDGLVNHRRTDGEIASIDL